MSETKADGVEMGTMADGDVIGGTPSATTNAGQEKPMQKKKKKKTKVSLAKKGFGKYIGPRTEMAIGFVVLLMIVSPAVIFMAALGASQYTITPDNCSYKKIAGRSQWGRSANPIPPATFYRKTDKIYEIYEPTIFSTIFGRTWSMTLSGGVCPNGAPYDWEAQQPAPGAAPTAAPGFPEPIPTAAPTTTPQNPVTTCLPYVDSISPGVWLEIDERNAADAEAGIENPVFTDSLQGAKNFSQAYNLLVTAMLFSWLAMVYILYDALTRKELKLVAITDTGRSTGTDADATHDVEIDNVSPMGDAEEEVQAEATLTDDIARDVVDQWLAANGGVIPPNFKVSSLERVTDKENRVKKVTYTRVITVELAIYATMFGFAVSVIKLIEESDLTVQPNSWRGFFYSCDVKMEQGAGVRLLYYQCVSMGLYVLMLLCCELYYLPEYLTQCGQCLTHPDQLALETAAEEDDGIEVVPWTGPVFLSRIYVTKVRAIKGAVRLVKSLFGGGKGKGGVSNGSDADTGIDSGLDPFARPDLANNHNIHDLRAEHDRATGHKGEGTI